MLINYFSSTHTHTLKSHSGCHGNILRHGGCHGNILRHGGYHGNISRHSGFQGSICSHSPILKSYGLRLYRLGRLSLSC